MYTGGVQAEFRALRHECRQQLEDLLPYPLIIVLQRRGAGALARTLAADISLPTVVWTAGVLVQMRHEDSGQSCMLVWHTRVAYFLPVCHTSVAY